MELESQGIATYSLDRKTRMEQGIFFTSPMVVEEIITHFDFSSIKTVIDSAAGSGNFLFPLAERYPNIQFFAVEKNPQIYQEAQIRARKYGNLHYLKGDIITDSFPIPPCDLYIGNPPFINFTDLPPEYREEIRPQCQRFLNLPKGFSLLLGKSRADISQLIFQITVEKYLKKLGKIGVILPDSLIHGSTSQMGFQQCKGFKVNKITELPLELSFEETQRSSFYVIAQKGKETVFPIPYHSREGKKKLIWNDNDHWLVSDSAQSSWPREWIGYYKPRQGLNTLGANNIFFFKKIPNFEKELIYPLLKSSDIHPWKYENNLYCLLPYKKDGRLISENELSQDFPKTWEYLSEHRKILEKRKSRFIKSCWYSLFGIGPYSFAPYKVTWRALGASKLQAALVEKAMANQAMHGYLPVENKEEGWYLCGLLNSSPINKIVTSTCKSGSKSFAQPGVIKRLPLPKWDPSNRDHQKIFQLSSSLAEKGGPSLKKELDLSVSKMLQE